jgi:hypothetical protein
MEEKVWNGSRGILCGYMELLRVFLDLKKVHTKTNVFSLDIRRCTMLNSASIVIQKTNKFCMCYEIF